MIARERILRTSHPLEMLSLFMADYFLPRARARVGNKASDCSRQPPPELCDANDVFSRRGTLGKLEWIQTKRSRALCDD